MEKTNKYYSIIEGLVRKHKKFPGCEAIIDEIIDDVYSHSEVIINSINNESVISAYLEKVVTTSLITVPKKMNIQKEIHPASETNVSSLVKNEKPEVDTNLVHQMINETKPADMGVISPSSYVYSSEEAAVESFGLPNEKDDSFAQLDSDKSVCDTAGQAEIVEVSAVEQNLEDGDVKPEDNLNEREEGQIDLSDFISSNFSDDSDASSDVEDSVMLDNDSEVFSDNSEEISDSLEIEIPEVDIGEKEDLSQDSIEEQVDGENIEVLEPQEEVLDIEDESLEPENIENNAGAVEENLSDDLSDENNQEDLLELDFNEDDLLEESDSKDDIPIESLGENILETVDDVENSLDVDSTEEILQVESEDVNELNDFSDDDSIYSLDEPNGNIDSISELEVLKTDTGTGSETLDYSVFSYTPDNDISSIDVENIQKDLLELNHKKTDLNIIQVYELKYKENCSVADIATQLEMSESSVLEALDEIIAVI